ncbi:MAG: hypothetical protein ABI183_16000 [Polyangiaceae bacterium]
MQPPTDYFSLVESYDEHHSIFSRLDAATKEEASKQLFALATRLLQRDTATRETFEKIAVWHADKFYRLVNQLDILDGSSLLFLRSVGAAFDGIAKARGTSVAYLVDNQVPPDRLLGVRAAFWALGFVVASPELFVGTLLEATPGASPESVFVEAISLAMQQAQSAVAERKHVLWVSGGADLRALQYVADMMADAPFVGAFRNDVPEDGTNVHVFRSGGRSEPLAT